VNDLLNHPDRLEAMRRASQQLGHLDGAARIAALLLEVSHGHDQR
jgi:UDP-N-acetylglucosamine:LPS N-acetylglucosamine transferase